METRMETRTELWVPRTKLGRMVQEGRLTSLEEIFTQGMKIRESMIVDVLEPNLQQEVLNIGLVQKQTDAGEQSRFRSLVAVGNLNGYIGLGLAKAKQVRTAIQKATVEAKLNLFPVKRGCGSWECGCGHSHSLPFKVTGKCGSVTVELLPAPRGVGLVAGETAKTLLRLVGIQDCWTKAFGATRTIPSFAYATYYALRSTYSVSTPRDWGR